MTPTDFDLERILLALEREGVRYVVIGGLAAVLRGSPVLTQDLDVCPAHDRENNERLARALKTLGARIRTEGAPDGLPFACDAEFFAGVQLVNLVTPYGDIDVAFEPSGTGGYADLVAKADPLRLSPDLAPRIAALEDVIRSKEAADRPKDRAALPALRTLLAEIRRRERDGFGPTG
jgi:hypothetical protein